jgi:hypothetical protein
MKKEDAMRTLTTECSLSVATVVVALISVEAVALILLLGGQVIAELERKTGESTEKILSGFET